MFKSFTSSILCATALTLAAGPTSVAAEQVIKTGFVEDVGGSERVNFSGKLRMLSQRIPNTACYLHAGIETEASTKLHLAAKAEFERIIQGLEHGDDGLGMRGAEQDRKVIAQAHKVQAVWQPLLAKINADMDAGNTAEMVQHLKTESAPLLAEAKLLVSEIVREHSDPSALLGKDALALDIAGRQRMLSQRMSKNACFIVTGFGSDAAVEELAKARKMFNVSAQALRFGMPAAGIQAIDNDEINARLDEVLVLWGEVQSLLDEIESGAEISDEKKTFMFNAFNQLTGKMNTIVGLYSEASKLHL